MAQDLPCVGSHASPGGRRPQTLEPLSDADFDALELLLARSNAGGAMTVEELDGFFTGLLAGPPVAKPCDYWPVVLGKAKADPPTLAHIRTTRELLPLLARHWHTIEQTLNRHEVHCPYLSEGEPGSLGREWARGFLHAVEMEAEVWQPLIFGAEAAAPIAPMMILMYEGHAQAELRGPAISATAREELLVLMAAGVLRARRFFSGAPRLTPQAGPGTLN
jgi:uncharacterized protein